MVGASPAALSRMPVDLADLNAVNARALGSLPFARAFAAYGRTKTGLPESMQGSQATTP